MSKLLIVNELHKPARKNFIRRSIVTKGIDDLWQADLIDMQKYATENRGMKYILVVIDTFSKFAWVVPVKSKAKEDIQKAMQSILINSGRRPKNLQTDLGKEFYNIDFRNLMLRYGINHYSTFSIKKASIVERLIRTLKSKLYKHFSFLGKYQWVGSYLDSIVYSYNNSTHRTIKCKPINVNKNNELIVRQNIINSQIKTVPHVSKFKVGDPVRISKYKSQFSKGYTPNWSTEIFKITNVNNTSPVTYHIEGKNKEKILGSFYEYELQKTKYPDIYLIEKVIRKKKNKVFVKWLGLSEKENSWVNINNLVN